MATDKKKKKEEKTPPPPVCDPKRMTVAALKKEITQRDESFALEGLKKATLQEALAKILREEEEEEGKEKEAEKEEQQEEKEEEKDGNNEAGTTKKRKASSLEDDDGDKEEGKEEEREDAPAGGDDGKKKEEKKEEDDAKEKEGDDEEKEEEEEEKQKIVVPKIEKKIADEEENYDEEFEGDDDNEEEDKNEKKDNGEKGGDVQEEIVMHSTDPTKCTMTLKIAGNEGRLIGKRGDTMKYIEQRFTVKIDINRDAGTCTVTGNPDQMKECKRVIEEVTSTGSISDRPASTNDMGVGQNLKEHETLNGISAANINAYSIDEDSLPVELRGIPNDQEVAIQIPCPGKEGRIIGKGGATIRDIERVSGANLKVAKGSGICNVNGRRIDVIRARQVVLDTMALDTDAFGLQETQQQQRAMTPSEYAMQQQMSSGGVYGAAYGNPMISVYGMGAGRATTTTSNISSQVPDGQTRIEIPTMGHEGRIIGKGGAHVKLLRDKTGCDVQLDRSKNPVTCVITGTAANVKECERMVNEAIQKANQTFGVHGAGGMMQQTYGGAAAQQQMMMNPYGAATTTAAAYPQAAAPVVQQVYGTESQQQPQQQQQLMQQYQQYYHHHQQQQHAYGVQQGYDPNQTTAASAAATGAAGATSDWATYYSEGKPYYYNSKTGETKWA